MYTAKTIKRSLPCKKIDKNIIEKLNDVIDRTNLFIINIYNFIKLYCVSYKINEKCITKDNLYEIFLILRDGDKYSNKKNKFYNFYMETFKDVYFNPIETNKPIDGSFLGQVIKNNIGVMVSSIENNITYNFDKHLSKFVKKYMISECNEKLNYNSLIKKCSLYECYNNIDQKFINKLQKEYIKNNTFSIKKLYKLCEKINGRGILRKSR